MKKEKTINEILIELNSSQRESIKQDMMMKESIASAELAKKPLKTCNSCHVPKDYSEFYKFERNKDGHRKQCIKCYLSKSKETRDKRVLLNKPICDRPGCLNKIPFYKSKYCSDFCRHEHQKIKYKENGHYKIEWQKLKLKPGYKEYHREKALDWQHKQQSLGNCTTCGKKARLNRKGLPSASCEYHFIKNKKRANDRSIH